MKQVEKLAKLIEQYKGKCTAIIDNDSWYILKDEPEGMTDDEQDEWYEQESVIAKSTDYSDLGVVYGTGILEALAWTAGLKVEDV